jgi:hypothetical protein
LCDNSFGKKKIYIGLTFCFLRISLRLFPSLSNFCLTLETAKHSKA